MLRVDLIQVLLRNAPSLNFGTVSKVVWTQSRPLHLHARRASPSGPGRRCFFSMNRAWVTGGWLML